MASDPIDYGIQRIEFRRQKLKKLITAGKGIDSRTVQAKLARWKRQLDRLDKSESRLSELKTDISTSRLHITQPTQLLAVTVTNSRGKLPSQTAAAS